MQCANPAFFAAILNKPIIIIIVTMALSRVVSEIFNVEKRRDLEVGVKGHSSSLKVVPCDRACMFSY